MVKMYSRLQTEMVTKVIVVSKTVRSGFESLRVRIILINMSELENKIIELRREGYSYASIQLKLGNPSKKFIKDTLKKYAPDLAGDKTENYKRW